MHRNGNSEIFHLLNCTRKPFQECEISVCNRAPVCERVLQVWLRSEEATVPGGWYWISGLTLKLNEHMPIAVCNSFVQSRSLHKFWQFSPHYCKHSFLVFLTPRSFTMKPYNEYCLPHEAATALLALQVIPTLQFACVIWAVKKCCAAGEIKYGPSNGTSC